jgi:hypothetical protein
MARDGSRRRFLKQSAAGALAAAGITSMEEYALASRGATADGPAASAPTAASDASPALPVAPNSKGTLPAGRIGDVTISRIICGGNLIGGYAHSRDLIYVSELLKSYFTAEKIMETWARCEEQGINTMIFGPSDERAAQIYQDYRKRGGRMQCIGQLGPNKGDIATPVKQAADAGMEGAVLLGNVGDAWTREDSVDAIGEFVERAKAEGMIAGVGGHELRTPMMVETAGITADFYMKTLHNKKYWSHQRPDQEKEIIDNYAIDNYWCREPDAVVEYMQNVKRPWLAYKVLAAGAIHPKQGFRYAFQNGADFCVVGMFDFQVAEDARIARRVLKQTANRKRPWYG